MNRKVFFLGALRRFFLAWVLLVGARNGLLASETNMATSGYFNSPFQDESQFIVQTIVSDLAAEEFYAKYHQLPDPKTFSVQATEQANSPTNQPVYQVEIKTDPNHVTLRSEVKLNGAIWSPDLYKELATKLAELLGLGPAPTTSGNDTTLLLELTDGTAATIEHENQSISKALETEFNNPVLHEKAAVLLGAFALREHSGNFFDVRFPLCRMTAHLSMAQLLPGGKPLGVNGRVANVMLLTLTHNQAAALEELNHVDPHDPALAAWANTLYADNTYDFRRLNAATNLTMIERIAWFEAYSRSVSQDIAWSKLGKEKNTVPDFCRIALEKNFSVELGHELLPIAMNLELSEVVRTYNLSHAKKIDRSILIQALNETPGQCLMVDPEGKTIVQVIGWGQWALFLQHHVCSCVSQCYECLQNKWSLPDDAASYAEKCDQIYANLRLYPFTKMPQKFNSSPGHASRADQCSQIISTAPQLVPAGCWISLNAGLFRHSRNTFAGDTKRWQVGCLV